MSGVTHHTRFEGNTLGRMREKPRTQQDPRCDVRAGGEVSDQHVQTCSPREAGAVLLVEDNDMVRSLIETMLKQLGYEVVTAGDGCDAVDTFRKERDRIGLVLSDVVMPRMDGWETMAAIRAIQPGFPVILASGNCLGEKAVGKNGQQPRAILQKPFSMAVLKETLEGVLEESGGGFF